MRPLPFLVRRLLVVAFNVGLLALLYGGLVHDPFESTPPERFVYGRGNADDSTRAQVLTLVQRVAQGYRARDITQSAAFVDDLFVPGQPVVLGTLPTEIFDGVAAVKRLVRSDWESWGDCRFHVDNAHVSSRGDVAWITTRGRVAFDLSRWLVVPLRLSAIAVKQADGWRLQQVQFQFDVDLSRTLAALLALSAWLILNFGLLLRESVGWHRRRPAQPVQRLSKRGQAP